MSSPQRVISDIYLPIPRRVVSLAAVFSIVTQRSSPGGGALRDDTKNGCEGDYPESRGASIGLITGQAAICIQIGSKALTYYYNNTKQWG